MTLPAFAILEEVLRGKRTLAEVGRLKAEVWNLPIWVFGDRTERPDGKIAFTFTMQTRKGARPVLPTYFDEAQAKQAAEASGQADKYITVGFCHLSLIAEAQRFDAELVDGSAVLMLTHSDILTLRDVSRMGEEGVPLSEADAIALTQAVRIFAAQAYDYCARQPEVRSLHLALVMVSGVTPSVFCMLNASPSERHNETLQELGEAQFRPGWRLHFCDPLDPTELRELLKSAGPWYAQEHPKGWWARLKRSLSPPVVPLVHLEITDH